MKIKTIAAAAVAAALTVGMPVAANAAISVDDKIKATLTGDVAGKAKFTAELGEDSLCYTFKAKRIGEVTEAHIHVGETEAIVVTLETPTKKGVSACIDVVPDAEDTEATLSESELAALRENPRAYYVDVHTVELPEGAARGQLR